MLRYSHRDDTRTLHDNNCFVLFRGKLLLGYSEVELVTPGSGYQFVHAADMMYCADNHLKSELSHSLHTFKTTVGQLIY